MKFKWEALKPGDLVQVSVKDGEGDYEVKTWQVSSVDSDGVFFTEGSGGGFSLAMHKSFDLLRMYMKPGGSSYRHIKDAQVI